jgi:4-amino-4-deoxy-L-arabinose transferase-like glycosyltransferase
VSFRGFGWLLLALVPVYLVLAAVVPPADDELYYWCWAKQLQLSYYDHPPMTAYLIRAGIAVFGDTLFATRLPAVVSTLTVLLVVGLLTRPRTLLPLVVCTPLFTVGAVLVTPDTPLLMFWALYVLWLVKVHEKLDASAEQGGPTLLLWLLGGVVLGCGILGKYTTGLAAVAGFLSFLVAGNWRRWFAGYCLHMAVAFLVTLPILVHNIRHDFAPLLYQWKHSMGSPEPGLKPFGEFVGMQVLLFGLVPFGVFFYTLRHFRELRHDPRLRVCACLFAFPFAFFLYKATRGPLEGNWALACYIAVWPLAAHWYETVRHSPTWRKVTAAAFVVPVGTVLLLVAHLVRPVPFITPVQDRITRQSSKMDIACKVAADLPSAGDPAPVFADTYQWTALLRFQQIDAKQIDGISRPSHFTQTPERPTQYDRVYVFAEGFLPPEFVRGFPFPPRIVGRYPLVVRGQEVAVFWLMEYAKPDGGAGNAARPAAPARLDPRP